MVVRRGDECVSLLYIYRCRVFQGFYKKNLPRFCCVFHMGLCSAFFFRYGLWCCCRFLVLLAVMRPLILSSLGFTLCFGFWCVVNGSERARWMCLPFTSVEYFRVCRKKVPRFCFLCNFVTFSMWKVFPTVISSVNLWLLFVSCWLLSFSYYLKLLFVLVSSVQLPQFRSLGLSAELFFHYFNMDKCCSVWLCFSWFDVTLRFLIVLLL